jgi:hypothetical protein
MEHHLKLHARWFDAVAGGAKTWNCAARTTGGSRSATSSRSMNTV